jgi:UPF0755 protein
MANKSTAVKLTLKITSFILQLLLNIVFYILVILLIVNFSKMAYTFTYQLYGPDTVDAPGTGSPIIFQINKGESTMDIASKLKVNRAIENKYSFYLKTKLENKTIMPGMYEISTDMTYDELLTVITDYSKSIIKEEDMDTGSDTGADNSTGTDSDATDTGTGTGTGTDTADDTGSN